jgi:esterase
MNSTTSHPPALAASSSASPVPLLSHGAVAGTMMRNRFYHAGLGFSYLDTGGPGRVLVALHAHWMQATTFAPLAQVLFPAWRVIAVDQRGHGDSDRAISYTRDDYLGDLAALLDQLAIDHAVLLGHALGGVNAYQFAARHPGRVEALIIEETGAVIQEDTSFSLSWTGCFSSRRVLSERINPQLRPYLLDSMRDTPAGARLAFDARDTVKSGQLLNGDHWADWLASTCPALLIRGRDSQLTDQAQSEEMAARRPNTSLVTLPGGHVVHQDNPAGFLDTVREFLGGLTFLS